MAYTTFAERVAALAQKQGLEEEFSLAELADMAINDSGVDLGEGDDTEEELPPEVDPASIIQQIGALLHTTGFAEKLAEFDESEAASTSDALQGVLDAFSVLENAFQNPGEDEA